MTRNGFTFTAAVVAALAATPCLAQQTDGGDSGALKYELLAATRTSTLEKELNDAAERGYRLQAMIGGETAFGGAEMVAVLSRPADVPGTHRYEYRILATNLTSTMADELEDAGELGFEFRAQTVMETAFGGREVVVALERPVDGPRPVYDYQLLATNRTRTMERELDLIGEDGFEVVGLTVAETAMGGEEVVAITRRVRSDIEPEDIEPETEGPDEPAPASTAPASDSSEPAPLTPAPER